MPPEAALLERLERDLGADRALSEGQLGRHYGLEVEVVGRAFRVLEAYLAPTHGSVAYRRVRFVALEDRLRCAHPNALRHLAGVAEMRRLLCVAPEAWRLGPAGPGNGALIPDAVWSCPQGEVAVEYDAGSYSPAQIRAKAGGFSGFLAQVWGSPSERRTRRLEDLLRNARGFSPLLARWD